jgi:hypothetical protein
MIRSGRRGRTAELGAEEEIASEVNDRGREAGADQSMFARGRRPQ